MEEEQEALNETSDVNTQEATPAYEETTEEDVQAESTEEAQTEETVGESRKGAQSRIRQLNSEKRAVEEEVRTLKEKLEELTKPVGFNPMQTDNQIPQDSYYNDDGTIDPVQYEAQIVKKINAQNELRFRQQEAINRINSEAIESMNKYPELNDKSEDFNKDLSDSITEAVEAHVRANPYSASVAKFVDKLMKPYTRAIDREVGQATENIAKQVSQAALRPTSTRQQEKPASEKSIAELEAELGMVHS